MTALSLPRTDPSDRTARPFPGGLLPLALRRTPTGYAGIVTGPGADGRSGSVEVDVDHKLRVELRLALRVILRRHRRLAVVSPALGELVARDHPAADTVLVRTGRMLKLLHALLDPAAGPDPLRAAAGQLRGVPALGQTLDRLRRAFLPLAEGGEWYTSPLLLLVVAVVYSQSEYFHPHRWEAFGGAQALQDLHRRWPGLPHPLAAFVAFLVHFQLATCQFARGTGDDRFLAEARDLADRLTAYVARAETGRENASPEPYRAAMLDTVLGTLRVLGVLEEARNRRLPGYDRPARPGRLHVNHGVRRTWDEPNGYLLAEPPADPAAGLRLDRVWDRVFQTPAEVEAAVRADNPTATPAGVAAVVAAAALTPVRMTRLLFAADRRGSPEGVTWAYFRMLGISGDLLAGFKEKVKAAGGRAFPGVEPSGYSLGRDQVEEPIRRVLAASARAVAGGANFDDYFQPRLLTVPRSYADGAAPEHTVEVRLLDHLAAEALVFDGLAGADGGEPVPPAAPSESRPGPSAGGLFLWLYRQARTRFRLTEAALRDGQPAYGPFPLITRLLAAVYRLRPETCAPVSVTFDGGDPVSIPVPLGLRGKPGEEVSEIDREALRCVANYIQALILNRGMSLGFRSSTLSFGGLIRPTDRGTPGLTGPEWRALIEGYRTGQNYDLLLESYLPLYNQEGRCAEMLPDLPPSTLKPVPIHRLPAALRRYLRADPGRKRPIFLGVDIGGTFTKVRAYELRGRRFEPVGESFSVLTPTGEGAADPGKEFATQLVAALARYLRAAEQPPEPDTAGPEGPLQPDPPLRPGEYTVLAIGLSWPGPVRAGRVAGVSGIVRRFGMSGVVRDGTLDALLGLDIVGKVSAALAARPPVPGPAPLVALINDGDADGTGVLAARPPRRRAGRRRPETLVVVKLGTGTAGTVFRNGRLVPGLAEWGKMLLDLLAGTPANRNEFPPGHANSLLSARTPPALVRRLARPPVFPAPAPPAPDWDSRELGLVLEAAARGWDRDAVRELLDECGLREYAARGGWPAGVTVDIFRQVLTERRAVVDPETFRVVQGRLDELGADARAALRRKVRVHGAIRLHRMLGLDLHDLPADLRAALGIADDSTRFTVDRLLQMDIGPFVAALRSRLRVEPAGPIRLADLVNPGDLLPPAAGPIPDGDFKTALRAADGYVRQAAERLGWYLGDFVVLLHDIYKMDTVVLTGGVLTGRTGDLVRESARRRVRLYGLELTGVGSELGVRSVRGDAADEAPAPDPPPETEPPVPDEYDAGTLGAAVFAASELLLTRRREGLNELKAAVLALLPGGRVVVPADGDDPAVTLEPGSNAPGGPQPGTLALLPFALDSADVVAFLDRYGTSLGLYRTASPTGGGGRYVYARWDLGRG